MSELERIIEKYFQKDTTVIVYYELDQELFNKVINPNNIGEYERPDILSIFGNKIVGIEHFEFDSYKSDRKGSDFRIKHNILEKGFQKEINEKLKESDSVTVRGRIESTCSLDNYFMNFKKNFEEHYKKIDSYIKHIEEDYGNNKEISICFFAEDVTPLGNYFMDRKKSMNPWLLNPLYSDEIIDLLKKSPKVKYLITGAYAMKEYKLTIIKNTKDVLDRFKKERTKISEDDYLSFSPQTTGFAMKFPKEELEKYKAE